MSDGLPQVGSREAIKAFQKIGFIIVPRRGKGSHTFMTRENPRTNLIVPHQSPLKRGLLRGLIRTAGLTVDQFKGLL
jgi:predicted RNA binding protein YcfA (HicA-like mRNA interferase family)